MTNISGLSDDDVMRRFADTMRAFVGHGRRMSWEALAAATGDQVRTLRSYCETDPNQIPLARALRILAVLPPEAADMMLEPAGLSVGPRDTETEVMARSVATEAALFSATVSRALEDGRIDHREEVEIAAHAARLSPQLHAIQGGWS